MSTPLFDAGSDDVLYLVDLSGFVFRAYHAVQPLSSPSGEPTNAVFGTVHMLDRMARQCQPKMLAVAMDSRTRTFRKEIYPEYKANRPPAPEDLKVQMKRTGELIDAYGIPVFQQDGVEADDLIATVVRHCQEQSIRVVIVSADKDLMQLVGDDVLMWDTMRNRVFGVSEVEERFGVRVNQLRDLLALMGDSSDNVPGVPSVGPKTAKDLLNTHDTLEGVYENLASVTRKKLNQNLTEYRDQAFLSQRLVTLKEDCDVTLNRESLTYGGRDLDRLRTLYGELGFQRQLTALDKESQTSLPLSGGGSGSASAAQPTPAAVAAELETVLSDERLDELLALASKAGKWALETQTTRGGPMATTLVGLGFAFENGKGYYVPLAHRDMAGPKQLDSKTTLAKFGKLIATAGVQLCIHNIKRSRVLLSQHGIELEEVAFDPMLAAYLLDASQKNDLKSLAARELGLSLTPLLDLTKQGRKRISFDEVSVADAGPFGAADADACFRLWERLEARIAEENLDKLYGEVELPLAPLLAEMEKDGVQVDSEFLTKFGARLGRDLASLEEQAHKIAGKEFNVNSPRQLEKLLFDDLGFKPLKRTKTARSTDAATLEALSEQHELPKLILEIRQLAKLKGTYVDALPALVHPKTGRIHCSWDQAVAATGRLSSHDPNLQNIPIRTELGRSIRSAFRAPDGYQLVSGDYSQVELRVLAHLSEDARLLEAFKTGQDIHTRTAMEIFEVSEDKVDDELRRRAKAVNFGVVYGQGDSGLAKSLGIHRMEAGNFIASYFRQYEGVRRFMDETIETARRAESISTLLGRRRLMPDIHHGNRARRLAAERIAMNTPIQGTAADLLKLAMLTFREPPTPGSRMILTVHDELVFEVPESEVANAKDVVRERMENVYPLRVPLVVDVGAGASWTDAH